MGNGVNNKTQANGLSNGQKNPLNMLDAVADLKRAGFEQTQAEAVVRMQYGLIESHLATKRDIEGLRAATKRDIKELELKIEMLRKDMTIKMGSIMLMGLGIVVIFAKLGWLSIS